MGEQCPAISGRADLARTGCCEGTFQLELAWGEGHAVDWRRTFQNKWASGAC